MSKKRFREQIMDLCPVPARLVLVALAAFVALAALASLLLLLSPGPTPVTAAPMLPAVGTDIALGSVPNPSEFGATLAVSPTGCAFEFYAPAPNVFGQSVYFTATVTSDGTPVTGAATVTFILDGPTYTFIATDPVDSGVVTIVADTILAGTYYTFTSYYAGDATFAPCGGPPVSYYPTALLVVNKADTTTTLDSAPNPSAFGETVTFTATVTVDPPGSGTPAGTVTFKDGAAAIGTGPLDASGVVTFTTCTLDVGLHSVTAEYGGDANFNGSTSAPLTQVVGEAEVTVTLESAPSPESVFGQTVTLTATVNSTLCAGLTITPTGVVFFNDSGVTIGTAALNASGVATMTTFSLVAGEHPLTAVYAGDEYYKATESAPLTQTVNKANTSTTLSSSDTTPVFGQSLTFTATVTESETVLTPGAGTPTGIVTFQDVFTDAAGTFTTTIGSGTLNGEGVAGFTISSLAVGQHTIIATYEGNANFSQSQTSMTFTVDKADTTTGVTHSSSNPSVYGESVTFTAIVSATLPGAGTPTGTVTFKVDGTAVSIGTLGFTNPGEVRWRTSYGDSTELDTAPADGNHAITAFYSGDGNFNGSDNSASPFTQTVNKADTTVRLQIPLAETDFGQSVRMTAIVSVDQPGGGTPTGTVIFTVATVPPIVVTGTLPAGGMMVTVVTNTIPVGTWNVVAAYGGDDHFNGAPSGTVEHKVNKTDSETTLESSANPSDFGQTLTFTATVEPAGLGLFASVEPTGTVTFTLGTVGVMTDTLDASGVATVVTDTLPAGEHEITAEYGGDDNFKPSEDTLRQTVNKVATTTELSGPPSSAVGDSVTFTATVSETLSGAPVTTGTVEFWDFTTVIYSDTLDVSGQATFTTASLSAGLHRIKAVYNGTANFQPSTSERLSHTVGAVGSTTTLTKSPTGSTVYGQSVDFTATVAGSGGTPTGQVTFKDGAATLGTGTLSPSGPPNESQATLSTDELAVGDHEVTAIYGGGAGFAGSTSNVVNHTVDKADTDTDITSPTPYSSVFGQPVTVHFNVTAEWPSSGTPTGNVTVDDGTDSCTGSVASAGSCTLTFSTPGYKTLTATYAGDDNFNDSWDDEGHDVDPADTTTTVTTSPNPSVRDQEVTITANVTADPPSTATPTGFTVYFESDGTPIGSDSLVDGTASITHTFTVSGTYNITADYTGDSWKFNSSNGFTTHNVNPTPADLSVTKTDSPDPVNVGDDLTYVINVTNNETDPVNVTLVDTLPDEVTFVSAPGCTHDGSALGGVVTCDLGSLAASGGSATVTIIVNVPLTTPAGTVLSNTAQAGAHSDTAETTVYRSPRRGDCNGDNAVNLADVWAIVRDIFDPTFQGTSGCDANKDQQVDAGDVPSTVLIMLNGLNVGGMGGDLNAPTEGLPALTLPDQVPAAPGGLVTLPVSFAANGHSITSLAFSVDYDETWLALDPTDHDGNGIPDAVIFSLPGEFSYSVTFDGGDADGEVDIFIGDISPPLTSLSDGPIVFMILNVDSPPGGTQGAVRFSLDPAASFGDTSGGSVPGTATPTGRYRYQVYLPVVFR